MPTIELMEETRAKWNANTDYALGRYRVLARFLGIWPLEKRTIISRLTAAVIVVIHTMAIIIYLKKGIDNGNCGKIEELLDTISLMTTSATSIIKTLIPHIHKKKMLCIVNSAVDDWRIVQDKKSIDVMLRYAGHGRLIFVLFMSAAYMSITTTILSKRPSFVRADDLDNNSTYSRDIPVLPNCWLSRDMSTLLYLVFYFYIIIQTLINGSVYVGGDVLTFGFAMHLCGQFDLLNESLNALDDNASEEIQSKRIAKISQRHIHLLKLAGEFDGVFNTIILIEIGTNFVMITASELILLRALKIWDLRLMMNMSLRILLLNLQIFMYSFIGEQLCTKTEQLKVSVYKSQWYNMPLNIVKDLKFIMMRTNYSFKLSAGKTCRMNLENFTLIIKSMFSYFSVLRLMIHE